MKNLIYLTLIFGFGIPALAENFKQSDWDKAVNLVYQNYEKEYRKRLEGTDVNPSYMANAIDKCNYWVKIGTHQPSTWSVMDHFNVNICEETVKLKDFRVRR